MRSATTASSLQAVKTIPFGWYGKERRRCSTRSASGWKRDLVAARELDPAALADFGGPQRTELGVDRLRVLTLQTPSTAL